MEKRGYILLSTVFRGDNFGSSLQAFALQKYIESTTGNKCIIVELKENAISRYRRKARILFKSARSPQLFFSTLSKHLNKNKNAVHFSASITSSFQAFTREYLQPQAHTWDELQRMAINENCIKCVCGSDQVWNPSGVGLSAFNFLMYSPVKKNVSYAASIGSPEIPRYNKGEFRKKVKNIACISVREKSAATLLLREFGIRCEVAVDPVLLVGRQFWGEYLGNRVDAGNYVFCYFLNKMSDAAVKIINTLLDQGKHIYILSRVKNNSDRIQCLEDVTPFDFLALICYADMVLTDSYHGMLFSILFNRDFFVFKRDYQSSTPQSGRITDLLGELGISERYIDSCSDVLSLVSAIQYNSVNHLIEDARQSSKLFIEKSLMRHE